MGYMERTDQFMDLAAEGISQLSEKRAATSATATEGGQGDLDTGARVSGLLDPLTKARYQMGPTRDAAIAELASREVAEGLSWLFAHTVVAVWAALEAFVVDVVVGELQENPDLGKEEPFAKVKGFVVAYGGLSPSERAEFLVGEVARNTGASLKRGVGRFEALLESVQLAGRVDKELVSCLFEMSQCRNLVVHRAAVVDHQFAANCPQFGLAVGDRLRVSFDLSNWYFLGASEYAVVVSDRVRVRAGNKAREESRVWNVPRPTGPPGSLVRRRVS